MNRTDSRSGKWQVAGGRMEANSSSLTPGPRSLTPPRGISLIEVLISMFVLLFGLMGVAAIFPVASHYVLEGDKRDRSAGLAQVAFEELKARKILQPMTWMYGAIPPGDKAGAGAWLITQGAGGRGPNPNNGNFNMTGTEGPGHAFVIDPLGTAAGLTLNVPNLDVFPIPGSLGNPWQPGGISAVPIAGERFPVRRLTLSFNSNWLGGDTAANTFRLRNDLAVVQPEAGDRPSIQRWAKYDPNTPTNPNDDTLLARNYLGDYSWLASVVPTTTEALLGLAPINNVKDAWYEVSTAVFYKREVVPTATLNGSAGSERLINGEFLNSSELAIYSTQNDTSLARAEVDTAVDGIKPGNWIAVMGVNQVTGAFMLKWYKVLGIDDETRESTNTYPPQADKIYVAGSNADRAGRYVMIQGPPWPESGPATAKSNWNLGVAILPGIVDVYTRVMQMETN